MITRAGSGHIGTSFSCLDIVSWLYLNELQGTGAPGGDVFFSSKGHDAPALYAVLTALGRVPFDKIHELRRLNGLPGHPDVATPSIEANTGSLGMGISKAKGMLLANRLLGPPRARLRADRRRRAAGRAVLGVARLGREPEAGRPHGDRRSQQDSVRHLGVARQRPRRSRGEASRSFGWHVARVDGHDIAALANTFSALRAVTDRPKIVIADTVKGRGVSRSWKARRSGRTIGCTASTAARRTTRRI